MSIVFECKVNNISKSRLPDIEIIDFVCNDDTEIKMDIHRSINIVKVNDKVHIELSKELPRYVEGKDFVGHGYVVTKRQLSNKISIYISLWGFLVILSSPNRDLDKSLSYMDKIYLKITKD